MNEVHLNCDKKNLRKQSRQANNTENNILNKMKSAKAETAAAATTRRAEKQTKTVFENDEEICASTLFFIWQDCFGSPFFNACIEALQLHEEMDKYNEWRDTLGKK